MLYLSGGWSKVIQEQAHKNVGLMFTPDKGNLPPKGRAWAADNGCFSKGIPDVSSKRWAYFRKRLLDHPGCLFVPAYDKYADWEGTLTYWKTGGRKSVEDLGVPIAIVLQDGCQSSTIPWDEIDAVFVGGTTAWKLTAGPLLLEAHSRGKWAHVGRVNSLQRLIWAHAHKADSVDGTHLAWNTAKTLPTLNTWMDLLDQAGDK